MSSIKELSVNEVYENITSDPGSTHFIDVRSDEEYAEAHAKGAALCPLQNINPENMSNLNLPSDKTIYVICRSGKRSMSACEILHSQGFEKLVNVAGGTLAWLEADLPVDK